MSLRARLLVSATALLVAAVLIATAAIGFFLQRFVSGQIDQRLDAQVMALASALRRDDDGRVSLAASFAAPPFSDEKSGWLWQVREAGGRIVAAEPSRAAAGAIEFRPAPGAAPPRPPHAPLGPVSRPLVAAGKGAAQLHARGLTMDLDGLQVTIAAAAPERAILDPLRDALLPVVAVMAALVAGVVLAIRWQVRIGLAPLRRLRDALAAVRAGRQSHVPERQPIEIAPLAGELNALIDETSANLERARRHVANLAHGLKTPLATLLLTLSEPGRDPDGEASALALSMDRRIRHHLGRARAAAIGGPARTATELKDHIDDLIVGLSRIHADRDLAFTVEIDPAARVACEPQDLDEMLGNLLDNACKWAKGVVRVAALADGEGHWRLSIDDDGEGIAPEKAAAVLKPGSRLDEAMPGHGFGLSISRELAELYGGDLSIGRSPLGGVRASLLLPAAGRG
ncbi:sensor histidine kinase [Jiella mangrovi]|nr:sensor histidine kinase [Jiella mangrovi]